jgi:hypothetical protein
VSNKLIYKQGLFDIACSLGVDLLMKARSRLITMDIACDAQSSKPIRVDGIVMKVALLVTAIAEVFCIQH